LQKESPPLEGQEDVNETVCIYQDTCIGRATLYKYFPDVEAILFAWHERHITGRLEHLAEVRDQADDAGGRLEAVLETYALTLVRPTVLPCALLHPVICSVIRIVLILKNGA
jgi:AcrR family transcriptional regulator